MKKALLLVGLFLISLASPLSLTASADGHEGDEMGILHTAVVCELHHGFDHFHWTGFYRTTEPGVLKIGPYQGGHGCLYIPFDKGICGAAARTGETQDVPDVHVRPEHIACSSSTNSEVVVPVKDSTGAVVAVLDVDSDTPAAFSAEDVAFLENVCNYLGEVFHGREHH